MKIAITLQLTIVMALASVNKWGAEDAQGVSALTKDNFAKFILDNKFVFVKFFAPWCGHCKKMAPSYAEMATRINESGRELVIAELDATAHADVAVKYGVKGYPTLKLFYFGEPIDYNGEREAAAIEAWIDKKLAMEVEDIKTTERLVEVSKSKLAVVLSGTSLSESLMSRFKALASNNEKIAFYTTSLTGESEVLGASSSPAVVMYRAFDSGRKVMSSESEFGFAEMREFVESNRFANVIDFDEEAAQSIFGGQKSAIFYFSDTEGSESSQVFSEVAAMKKVDIVFSKSTITSGFGQKLADYIGVTPQNEGSVRLVKFVGQDLNKYKLESVTKESLEQFLADFSNDKLTPYRKSHKSVENDTEPVKTVVGDDFDAIVLNNDRYVLVEVYAPWCGHCKQLAPIYTELAIKLANVENLVITKMEGTGNEHPAIKVKGFPLIQFFKKGSKDAPVEYKGGRDLESMIAFIKKEMGDDFRESENAATKDL
jgi:protein disulfide-isomerase A1